MRLFVSPRPFWKEGSQVADDILKIKAFDVQTVSFGDEYKFNAGHLVIPQQTNLKLPSYYDSIKIRIIYPHHHNVQVNSIMDIVPISAKVLGEIGTGLTHTLTGVVLMITGADVTGKQLHDFGSSNGLLKDQLQLDTPGTPGSEDYIISFDVMLGKEYEYSRKLFTDIFRYADDYLQPIRKILKMIDGREASENHEYHNYPNQGKGKPNVAIVKQVSGQGAMYDNLLFPTEPSGMQEGESIIDMDNFPVLLTPNEYRDGAIHAMV